ncbi:Signal transduction histidine kinase [Oceanobacillus limi]|uniref:Signal transduction histidine-protein kinase ArlS n=1 Tax=Oceanobacillus limi TaxID=930131 RepID=A0A1I0AQV4_9BACI|nr:HAMP domain-containing sensor histidine kinase [Oceanobacillus limi]SES96784.1 Signal transduction histidine kinase [Oceanobacillus limi]
MRLHTKIQLFSSLFMLVLIVIINSSIYYLFNKLSIESELEELETQTTSIVESLNANPDIDGNELLKAYLPTDGMIRIIPKEGDMFVHSKDKDYFNLPGEFLAKETHSTISYGGALYATISRPIIWSDGRIVTLQIYKQLKTHSENMQVLLYVLGIASLIILVPTIIAGNVLSRFLLKPIKELIYTMNANTKHTNWEKLNVRDRSKDEIYELEKAYNDMIEQLRESYEKQEIFVSDASHELKTPISIIKSYAQLVDKRGQENPEIIKESVEAINSEADRMHKLVEQMLVLAKNKEVPREERVNIIDLCKETVEAFKKVYDRRITLENSEQELHVVGNEAQLQQVIYIVLDNALKYSEQEVHLKVHCDRNKVAVSIMDYGNGILESDQSLIFERFYRVDKARSRNTGGTGLGLAIAKVIINAHNGELKVESKLGEGSTFTFMLPLS